MTGKDKKMNSERVQRVIELCRSVDERGVDPFAVDVDDIIATLQKYFHDWDSPEEGIELYEKFIRTAVDHAIIEKAAWYCWHASRRQAMLEECWTRAGALVHQQIIWVKDRGVLTRSHYLWKHEPCFMGWRRPNRPPKVAEQTLPSTWEMPSFAKDERPDHPTPKPLDAFGIPMRQHVARGGLCYEPFSGSGSQIMAGDVLAQLRWGLNHLDALRRRRGDGHHRVPENGACPDLCLLVHLTLAQDARRSALRLRATEFHGELQA